MSRDSVMSRDGAMSSASVGPTSDTTTGTETSASATGTIGATIGTTIPGATMTGATAGGGEGQPQHSERR